MSHGRVFKIKSEERKTIQQQIDEFFKNGGKIKKIEYGVSSKPVERIDEDEALQHYIQK